MKLIIKTKSHIKLYSHQLEYDTLVAFIKSEFPDEQDHSITYQDIDGDEVVISSQIDLDALIQENQDKQFVKVILKQTPGSSSDDEPVTKQIEQIKQKKQASKKKPHREKRQKSQKKEKKPKPQKSSDNLKKIQEKSVQHDQKDPNIHEGIQCNNCKALPIVGPRYYCLQCSINICSLCQENFEHQHDFLKIKKYRNQVQLQKKYKQVRKTDRRSLRSAKKENKHSSSSEQKSTQKHKKIKRQKDLKIAQQKMLKKKCKKLSKFFEGKPEEYEEFIKTHMELDISEIISAYAKEKNINLEQKYKDNFNIKINKLSLFFNKPTENYEQFVKEHPEQNFRGLIKILKDKGLENYDKENFKNMMKRAKQQRLLAKQGKTHKKNKKNQEYDYDYETLHEQQTIKKHGKTPKPQKIHKSPAKQKADINKKMQVLRQKGKMLLAMKDLFGQKDRKKYYLFIEENFELGQDKIIEKYIEQNFERN